MENENSPYSIGIDLGTTNCALAFFEHKQTEEDQSKGVAESFLIPQIVERNMVESQSSLPSFLYQYSEHEYVEGGFSLPWNSAPKHWVGQFARQQGEKTPQRLVSSAKSWLCAPSGQHNANLPLSAPSDVELMSSVTASAAYLEHLRHAWNRTYPNSQIAKQEVILTVPASFDVLARDLTLEAARNAYFPDVILLEEPIAAFYAWIAENPDTWRDEVSIGDVILVCDIGGGTTDFSLITVEDDSGSLRLSRVAVGEHILLGGDNMDLALAHTVQLKLQAKGKKLEQWQFFALAHGCRKAKERLLSEESLDKVPVVIPGKGRLLFGKTLSSEVTRADIEQTLLEGFFAPCSIDEHPSKAQRMGLRTLGLNYARDSSILKHLAKFLCDSKHSVSGSQFETDAEFIMPTAVLFNGGASKATLFQNRITSTLNQWLGDAGANAVKTLCLQDPDLSVSKGAAYYGSVRRGKGVRIQNATVLPYYIGIESAMPAIPGMPPLLNGLCVAPAGMEEGTSLDIPSSEFGLLVGESVQFRFFTGRDRTHDAIGSLVENAESSLEEISLLEVHLDKVSPEQQETVIPVHLRVALTELGALELWCECTETQQQWKLEFNLRAD